MSLLEADALSTSVMVGETEMERLMVTVLVGVVELARGGRGEVVLEALGQRLRVPAEDTEAVMEKEICVR